MTSKNTINRSGIVFYQEKHMGQSRVYYSFIQSEETSVNRKPGELYAANHTGNESSFNYLYSMHNISVNRRLR